MSVHDIVDASSALVDADRHLPDLSRCPESEFGPLRVRVPPEAVIRMSSEEGDFSDAVYFDFATGTVRLGLFAAPRSEPLWPDRANEIAAAQSGIGARVRSSWGDWGPELHITDDGEENWVIGVDGPRWMLLGRATWSTDAGWALVAVMRSMIRETRVERGDEPMPVRTPLMLRRPGAEAVSTPRENATPYAAAVTMRRAAPDTEADPVAPEAPASRPERAKLAVAPAGRETATGSLRSGAWAAAAAAVALIAGCCFWLTQRDPGSSAISSVQAAPAASAVPPVTRPPGPAREAVDDAYPQRPAPVERSPEAPQRNRATPQPQSGQPQSGQPRVAPPIQRPPSRTAPPHITSPPTTSPPTTPSQAGQSRRTTAPQQSPSSRPLSQRAADTPAPKDARKERRTDRKTDDRPDRRDDRRSDRDRPSDRDRDRSDRAGSADPLGTVGDLAGQLLRIAPR